MKISPGIKRKQALKSQTKAPDFECVLPSALAAIRLAVDDYVEINEVYISLKSEGALLSYSYKDLEEIE
ncbi:hypothetical protein NE298_10965 [Lactococcus lactis]|uniref:hypothetical protein n=1 Tax=Lactococcus lactis TaxID=1358 RepID=UPI00207428E7|nr:hypothetical protein [Lactococcus lactis]MCM6847240.1 hypothetical protein [Lactococcus lactis]